MSFFSDMTTARKRGLLAGILFLGAVGAWRYFSLPAAPDGAGSTGTGTPTDSSAAAPRIEINAADSADFEALPGLGPVLSARIVKYRRRKGGFRDPAELNEVYGIDSALLSRLGDRLYADTTSPAYRELAYSSKKKSPYTSRPGRNAYSHRDTIRDKVQGHYAPSAYNPPARTVELAVYDLNTADSAQLTEVSGIGPKTAGRIVRFRAGLGYFHSVEQLREVWGLNEENYERMRKQLFVAERLDAYPQLHINSATADVLKAHIYLKWKEAQRIVAYREQHGDFSSEADLRKVIGVPAETWDKLLPYIRFD